MRKTLTATLLALLMLAAWSTDDMRRCRWEARAGDYVCR